MKKIMRFMTLFYVGVASFSCSVDDDEFEKGYSDAETFGKQLSENLRYTVTEMRKNHVDFKDLSTVKSAVAQYSESFGRQSLKTKASSSISGKDIDDVMNKDLTVNLTPIQKDFWMKIEQTRVESKSLEIFLSSLKTLTKQIQTTVPEIEQKKLIYATAALFYLTKEMNILVNEGLIPVNVKSPRFIRLQSGTENSATSGNLWEWCSAGLSYVWLTVTGIVDSVGSATWIGVTGATVAGTAVFLCAVSCIFIPSSNNYCLSKYDACIAKGGPNTYPNSGGYGTTQCNECRKTCYSQGYWPSVCN